MILLFLKDLENELKINQNIIYFNFNDTFEKINQSRYYSKELDIINKILFKNRYFKFPSDYTHCLIANHVYCLNDSEQLNGYYKNISNYLSID